MSHRRPRRAPDRACAALRPAAVPVAAFTASLAFIVLALAPREGAAAVGARLGRQVVPAFESIRLALDPAKPAYTGSVRVELNVRAATSSFDFHARDLMIERLTLGRADDRTPSGEDRGVPLQHATEGDVVRVTAAQPLDPGAYTLDIDFSADFDTQAAGLYRLQADDRWYAFTQFEATDARGAFPCWDEPEFKIPFQLTLVVPKDDVTIGNTPIASETVEGDRKTVVFEKTPPLPTYLLAIATGPLETVAMQGMPVPGRVVTVKGSAGLAGEAARVTPPLVAALEKYFGIPYPYRKLDVLAVPEFWAGAMENAGAITFADRILLIDPRAASVPQRRGLVLVMAHELAQWCSEPQSMPAAFGLMRSSREGDPRWDGFRLGRSFGERVCPIGDSFRREGGVVEHPGTGVRVKAFS